MKLHEHERLARQALAEANVESPGLCGRVLVRHAAELDRTGYLLASEQELSPAGVARLADFMQRRISGEPLAYIIGKREFYGRDFSVSVATLIPRPETELLIDTALANLDGSELAFADLGCGSGCIGLTLLCERPRWRGTLIDIDAAALALARRNAAQLGVNAMFLQGDLFRLNLPRASLDLVISNPPYVAEAERDEVAKETLAWEPRLALFSGKDGLAHLEAVIYAAYGLLKSGGHILLEHGYRQRDAVCDLLSRGGFAPVRQLTDLSGLPRAVFARKREE